MILKTYRAPSMADALALVKKDLGKDAVILSTRSLKVGGFLGFGGKTLVEITASDQAPLIPRKTAPAGARAGESGAAGPAGAGALAGALTGASLAASAYRQAAGQPAAAPKPAAFFPAPEPKPDPLAAAGVRVEVGPNSAPSAGSAGAEAAAPLGPQSMPVRASRLATRSAFAPGTAADSEQIQRELSDIKLLVNQVLQASPLSRGAACSGAGLMPEALFSHYLKLLESQVSRDIADEIIGAVRDELTPGELEDADIVRSSVLRRLAGLIPVDESAALPVPRADGRPIVIALVGPTGVGKTTTIAKLAAAYKLRHGRSVGLITSDTYRIAAVDQLRTYASIIGLPLKVVLTPEEMAGAIGELAEHDIILIDTAGRSQHNADRLEELATFLGAARPDQTHLVLSSASSEAVMLRTAQAFAPTRPDHVILTKLDEAVNFGVVVNVVRRVSRELAPIAGRAGIALSFVTTGQEVPDHIEPGRAERLARAVLDNRLPVTEGERRRGAGEGRPECGEAASAQAVRA